MFAPVRTRSLKPRGYRVSSRASERDRTRASAEPCHSCHALRPIGGPDRNVKAGAVLKRRSATAYRFRRFRRFLIAFDVRQEPSLRVVKAILYRKEAWSTT